MRTAYSRSYLYAALHLKMKIIGKKNIPKNSVEHCEGGRNRPFGQFSHESMQVAGVLKTFSEAVGSR